MPKIYDPAQSLVGFDNSGFDSVGYAKTSAIEIRNIIAGVFNKIFVGVNSIELNQLFFLLLNYILSEQVTVDWLFKSSFISVVQNLRKLEQFPAYIADKYNETTAERYWRGATYVKCCNIISINWKKVFEASCLLVNGGCDLITTSGAGLQQILSVY